MASGNNPENNMFQFDNFGSIQAEPTDHYYLNSNNSDTAKKCLNKHNTLSTIMKEWKILSKNLPDSIYVRVYESRIDLLRAAILGPAGTPYHDGIFFFDILLPYDYPKQPPTVYYHSHGYHINPNLYKTGYVCLSLINTWSGEKNEMWTKKSTLLQILVSIQGLVLNDRPYFNEPGFGDLRNSTDSEWINRSIRYNEESFLLSCKTMLHVIRNPPQNFEGLVVGHFRDRAASILAAIKDYQEGRALIGQFPNTNEGESSFEVSPKFKADLMSLHSDFENALSDLNSVANNMNISAESVVEELPRGSSSTTNSAINNNSKESTESVVKKELPIKSSSISNNSKTNKKGFLGKLVSKFGKCYSSIN
ncbi:hypothetical protein ABFS83_14G003500 [Erythranthe nasuta]